jgi:hypothetical protein
MERNIFEFFGPPLEPRGGVQSYPFWASYTIVLLINIDRDV